MRPCTGLAKRKKATVHVSPKRTRAAAGAAAYLPAPAANGTRCFAFGIAAALATCAQWVDNGAMTGDPDDEGRSVLLPGRVGLFVRLAAHPGGRPGLLDALHRYADQLGAEAATEVFVIALDPDDADIVWIYEWFTDEEALNRHRASAPFAELVGEIPELLAAPPGLLRIDPLRLHMQSGVLNEAVWTTE